MNCSPPGSSVHEIFQARILEWVAISFSGDLPNPGIEPRSPALQADSLLTELQGKLGGHCPHLAECSLTPRLNQDRSQGSVGWAPATWETGLPWFR